jgi:hypothetical protein
MMDVDKFKLVLKEMEYGNVTLQYGKTNGSSFSITFTDVVPYDDAVEFWYNPDELAEQTPRITIEFEDILNVQKVTPADGELGLYGSYGLQITMKNNITVRIIFDVKDEKVLNYDFYKTKVEHKNQELDSKQTFYDAVFSHKGGFQVNVNSFDIPEIEKIGGLGMEFHDLYFRDVMPLASDKLISFGNCSIESTKISEDVVPFLPIECNSGLYINKSKIDYVEKLDKDEYADMFELGISTAIYNIYMLADTSGEKRNVVTVGFID